LTTLPSPFAGFVAVNVNSVPATSFFGEEAFLGRQFVDS